MSEERQHPRPCFDWGLATEWTVHSADGVSSEPELLQEVEAKGPMQVLEEWAWKATEAVRQKVSLIV